MVLVVYVLESWYFRWVVVESTQRTPHVVRYLHSEKLLKQLYFHVGWFLQSQIGEISEIHYHVKLFLISVVQGQDLPPYSPIGIFDLNSELIANIEVEFEEVGLFLETDEVVANF